MSKPSPAKKARQKARAIKAIRHENSRQERYDRAEARRQAHAEEAAEAARLAAEARRVAWEAGAADREAELKARLAEHEARRAARALDPEPEPRPTRRRPGIGGAMTFMLLFGALMGGDDRGPR